MKRIILFFAVCLGLSVSQTTSVNRAFAATKRTQTTVTSTKATANRSIASDTKRTDTQQQKNARTATKSNQQKIVNRSPSTTQTVKSRTNQPTKNVTTRTVNTPGASTRSATTRKVTNSTARTATTPVKTVTRVATKKLDLEKMESIKSADYSSCKTVYYECMDEFCANKDANLRRCACSSRIHEFDNVKKQLSKAEDKMLDFNQRLLTVSMDKEDAAAINIATEGENAYQTKDRSKSEKILQKITKSLNSSNDSKINNDTSVLSWDLNLDSAWDDVDAVGGILTSSKTGLDLYNAARPICIEMAKEVCSDDELKIAQDGYKLTIQQDCNTVAKSYDTLQNQVIEKVHESNALLDMSRLNVYQERNADDTLTCKKKILNQLSSTSVCGENLYKCLDMTGEYIDPSNGKAFLSENLYNFANILQEPTGEEKWSTLPQNERFVNFLKSKKKFLEPATKQCQDIADTIWKEFLDDALSQIKLAQKAKLEEIRQSCTKLVAECKTNALNDLSEFDSRALSVFSVIADKTANEMCSRIQNSCVAVMDINDGNSWSSGISGITTDITYDTVIDTCTQVGRDCIIQKCNGSSGNFALCTNLTSSNRMMILKRDACWNEVLNCVRSADNLDKIKNGILSYDNTDKDKSREKYYKSLYSGYNETNKDILCKDPNDEDGATLTGDDLNDCLFNQLPKFCVNNVSEPLTETDLAACLIAEQIWGNCENDNKNRLLTTSDNIATRLNNPDTMAIMSNKILMPQTDSTLLSWFATNTNTTNNSASCNTYGCPINYQRNNDGTCQLLYDGTQTTDCGTPTRRNHVISVTNTITNFCESGVRDTFNNCCANGYKHAGICVPGPQTDGDAPYHALWLVTTTCTEETPYYCPDYDSSNPRKISIYCITQNGSITQDINTGVYSCDGTWVLIDQYGNYFNPATTDIHGTPLSYTTGAPTMSYAKCDDCDQNAPNCTTCNNDTNNPLSFGTCNDIPQTAVPTDNEFMITYQ